MISFDRAKTILDKVGEKPVAYDVEFQSDATVHKTLLFTHMREKSLHLYIDVDDQNVPIAVTLVHPPAKRTYEKVDKSSDAFKHAMSNLYVFASQMAVLQSLPPPPHERVKKAMHVQGSPRFGSIVSDEQDVLSTVFGRATASLRNMEQLEMAGA